MSFYDDLALGIWEELDTPDAREHGRSSDDLATTFSVNRQDVYFAVGRLKEVLQEPHQQPLSRRWVWVDDEQRKVSRYFLTDAYEYQSAYEIGEAEQLRTRLRRFSKTVNASALKWKTGAGLTRRRHMRLDAQRLLEDIETFLAEYQPEVAQLESNGA